MRKTKKRYNKKNGGKMVKTKNNFVNKYNYNSKVPLKSLNPLKKLNCSPVSEKIEIKDYSCYSNTSILKLRDIWNDRHPDAKILSTNPKEIHNELYKHLQNVCDTEACWLKQTMHFGQLEDEDMKGAFAPKSPKEWKKNPNEWLSSLDISKVMKQYEKAYPCFAFIGPTPIDFDTVMSHGECVWEDLCKLNIERILRKGKNKIGIVFNTDPHNKSGEHWISMFIKINMPVKINMQDRYGYVNEGLKHPTTGNIFFFDSVGSKPPKEVKTLVKRIIAQGKNMMPPIHFTYDQNHPVEHQYGNTECGVYSLFFIVEMLKDKITGNYLKTHILKDDYIHTFRKKFFNSPDS
jgi:hypothetical protein